MTSEFIPVTYLLSEFRSPFDQGWALRVQTRLRRSAVGSLRSAVDENRDPTLWRIAESLATKAELLDFICRRLINSWKMVEREVRSKRNEIDRLVTTGQGRDRHAVGLDHESVFNLLLDFEIFVFEVKSFVDYLARFLSQFHLSILGQSKQIKDGHIIIENLVLERVGDDSWASALKYLRDLFIHEQTTWLDIELRSCESGNRQYQPVFLVRGLTMGDPNAKGVNGDQIAALARGLLSIGPRVEEHLFSAITDAEVALGEQHM